MRKRKRPDAKSISDELIHLANDMTFSNVVPVNASTVTITVDGTRRRVKVKPRHRRDCDLYSLLVEKFFQSMPPKMRRKGPTLTCDLRLSEPLESLEHSNRYDFVITAKTPALTLLVKKFKEAIEAIDPKSFETAKDLARNELSKLADDNARKILREACERFFKRGLSLSEAHGIINDALVEDVHRV